MEEENASLRQEHQKLLQYEEENVKLKKENQKLKYKVKQFSEKTRSSTVSVSDKSYQVRFHNLTMQVKKLGIYFKFKN